MSGTSRFVPGELVHDRYRIVALLGRGGMGEVYRAEDLKLEQEVALKFLPAELADSPTHLERFHAEVRVARKVSHPGVCRVHDIGEVNGKHYLTMEYVDGEDLASLLRRIGRLPEDKALEIAHQLCAGLAAAHDQGVLHRDLKPANVMIDGAGSVRIADFGLSALAADLGAADARVGTPKYMAPEQLAGKEVTGKSDLFSLGLVLFELFTGRPAFEAKTLEELMRAHDQSSPSPSVFLPNIDPAVESVLQRCLAKEPSERPASAREVAAGLPGGDPLAAALAAGEMPSPELVAAAGGRGALTPRTAGLYAAGIVIGFLLLVWADRSSRLLRVIDPQLSTEILDHRGGEIAARLGFESLPDSVGRWTRRRQDELFDVESEDPWHRIGHPLTLTLRYWWRGAQDLAPLNSSARVDWNDPPRTRSGSIAVILGHDGRLLDVLAPPVDAGPGAPPFDWSLCFEESRLDMAAFEEVEPTTIPAYPCDEQRQWSGTDPEVPGFRITVYGAAFRGRPVQYAVLPTWDFPAHPPSQRAAWIEVISRSSFYLIEILTIVGSLWIAIRNLFLKRGDRRSAMRVAFVIFGMAGLQWVLQAHHTTQVDLEFRQAKAAASQWLMGGALAWLMYVALEPAVRATWPHKLVSWTRLVSGRFGDPSIGREVLIGILCGIGVRLLMQANWLTSFAMGDPSAYPQGFNSEAYRGIRMQLGEILEALRAAGGLGLLSLFLYVILLRLVRRHWIVLIVLFFVGLARMPYAVISQSPWVDETFRAAQLLIILSLISRGGLVAMVFAFFTLDVLSSVVATLQFKSWYSGPFELVMTLFATLTLFSCVTTTRGRVTGK